MECRYCGSVKLVKFGVVYGKQRYKCNDCTRSTRRKDGRVKYSPEKKLRVIRMHQENIGIRSIERHENIPNSLIVKWVQSSEKFISNLLRRSALPKELKTVEIIEMDELYDFIKKRKAKSSYGLLLIGTKAGLLLLKPPKT